MLRLEAVPAPDFRTSLDNGTFRLKIGRFSLRVESNIPELPLGLLSVYDHYPVSINGGRYDYDLQIRPASTLRRWIRRNAVFSLSGQAPFLPMAAQHAHALFEWGLNWTIGSSVHQYLVLHSAVVERNGRGVLLAATSGSGKSTLAAELAMQGWRLLSDELALIDGPELSLVPFPRPISLKNQSIDIIRGRHKGAVIGQLAQDTQKGTIAHLRVPDESVDRADETVMPVLIVFPKWSRDAELRATRVGPGEAAMRLIDQSFNYPILGLLGFERLADLVSNAEAWEIEYSSLDDAVGLIEDLVADVA
jgi:HprK-related kinase A